MKVSYKDNFSFSIILQWPLFNVGGHFVKISKSFDLVVMVFITTTSADTDDMSYSVAFHRDPHCLV